MRKLLSLNYLRALGTVASVFLIVALSASALAAAQGELPDLPTMAQAVRHDTSSPLRDLVPRPPQRAIANRQIRLRVPVDLTDRFTPAPGLEDPVRQIDASPTPGASPTPSLSNNFKGLSDDDNAAVLGFRVVPPDTNGDVGPIHYVQIVNLIFAVYDKATGTIVPGGGPFSTNMLWQGFGGICETNNDGDPIVLYDHLAGRWVFSQFAIGNRDGHQCIAVSQTGDPTGSYYRYDFLVSPRAVNDYPKLGVWSDGYYMTANEFGRRGFRGAIAVAFERDAMLAGDPIRMRASSSSVLSTVGASASSASSRPTWRGRLLPRVRRTRSSWPLTTRPGGPAANPTATASGTSLLIGRIVLPRLPR